MHGTSGGYVTNLTDHSSSDPDNGDLAGYVRGWNQAMSMTELVIGAALGFVLAQLALHGTSYLLKWLRTDGARGRLRRILPMKGSAVGGFFVRYAAPISVSAALVLMGAWAVGDYLKARAAHGTAMASTFDATPAAPPADGQDVADAHPAAPAAIPAVRHEAAAPQEVAAADPYADPEFKVRRKPHKSMTLKETLLEKSEARARADLLRETQQHMQRSQYDCEAADRAAKYVAADLDVWGFAAWQMKYFPTNNYKGATLAQCKDVNNVIDPSWLNLQSAVAQGDRH
jgi:hypothetical protein